MSKDDTFYLVKIPAYKGVIYGAPRCTIDVFGRSEHIKGEPFVIDHPEKKLWFDTKKAAKRYCLEHDIPVESIRKVKV